MENSLEPNLDDHFVLLASKISVSTHETKRVNPSQSKIDIGCCFTNPIIYAKPNYRAPKSEHQKVTSGTTTLQPNTNALTTLSAPCRRYFEGRS
jgi:hypothetical protein